MKVYGTLDSAAIEQLSANPTPAYRGRIYYNTSTDEVRVYNGVSWAIIASASPTTSNRTVNGTLAAPVQISAAGGVTPGGSPDEMQILRGDNGAGVAAPVTVTATPPIAAGANPGDRLSLYGTSDANYVQLNDNTATTGTLRLNGDCRLGANNALHLTHLGGGIWKEDSRS